MHFFPLLIEWNSSARHDPIFGWYLAFARNPSTGWAQGAPGTGDGHKVNLIAIVVSLAISGLLTLGIKGASKFNNLMVIIKLVISL